MHPAYSVIFFTTASGAGYGLLALIGVFAGLGLLPSDRLFGIVALGIALGLVSGGLLSSIAHLGRPERAWRAFSQWRTSWLSREGIAAVATFFPAGLFGIGWVVIGRPDPWVLYMGALMILGSIATVTATAMIYASLKPVPNWYSAFTVPSYLIFAAVTGLTLLNAILQPWEFASPMLPVLTAILCLAAGMWRQLTWAGQDATLFPISTNSAIGIKGGTVRSIEWPHSEENYVLKEMGFCIGRKHARRLRHIALAGAFAAPAIILFGAVFTPHSMTAALSIIAALVQLAGMLVERWLFFAEARHVVTLYYR